MPQDRALIYDIHCTTDRGDKIIVEMQNRYQSHFDDRAIYYIATDLVSQARKGKEWDYSLTPVFGVFFLKLPLLKKTPQQCEDTLDMWLYLLKNLENMKTMPKSSLIIMSFSVISPRPPKSQPSVQPSVRNMKTLSKYTGTTTPS